MKTHITRMTIHWQHKLRRLSVPYTLINHVPKIRYMVECTKIQPNALHSHHSASLVNYFTRPQFCRGLPITLNKRVLSHIVGCRDQEFSANFEEQFTGEYIPFDSYSNSAENFDGVRPEEKERRIKIGLANKGRVPWNKGRKHSKETRERIRQRTKEALRNPKVRKKMTEGHRGHSKQTKARIGSSLRRLWGERLKLKKSREKFIQLWAESIAKSAKNGWSDQDELDWDSYDKIKREIALEQLKLDKDKAKAKEMKQIRAARAAQVKAEEMARLAEKRKERELKAKIRGEMKIKTHRKSKEEKEELAIAQELKLKARLTKIHRKKSSNDQVTCQDCPSWERLDAEFIKRERIRKQVSLADQIRAVKNARPQVMGRQDLTAASIYPPSERSAE
ncbi:hypothetical protein LguiA_035456 [Lonicera macranthoides]